MNCRADHVTSFTSLTLEVQEHTKESTGSEKIRGKRKRNNLQGHHKLVNLLSDIFRELVKRKPLWVHSNSLNKSEQIKASGRQALNIMQAVVILMVGVKIKALTC